MTWSEQLTEDEQLRDDAVREFTLRVFRRGADPINHWILRTVTTNGSATIETLEPEVGLTKASLSERVNDLVQVGLLSRTIDGDGVQPTVLTEGFLGVVEDVTDRVSDTVAENHRSMQ